MTHSRSRFAVPCLSLLLCGPGFAQVTQRVSVASDGSQANGGSLMCSVSADGRFVAFQSSASSLVPGGSSFPNIFVHDRVTGTTERVSVSSRGAQANGNNFAPAISADGRYVAFSSTASNLVPGDTNARLDVFVHDRQTATTERVSVDSAGVQGNQDSEEPSLSADGRYVAFHSLATNLAAPDTNGGYDVFVRDRQTGATELVSVDSNGVQGNNWNTNPSISADGRYVGFHSIGNNLVGGDTNGVSDVFLRDRQSAATDRVSVSSGGAQANSYCYSAAVSADGRYISFRSSASNLVTGDTNFAEDVFVHNRQTGVTELVSVDSNGAQGDSGSVLSSISADGRYVAFYSHAENLVRGDTNGTWDAFLRDRQNGTTERVSVSSDGAQGNGGSSERPSLSADGRYVAFSSSASNLVDGDTNASLDIFVRDRAASGFTSLCDPGLDGVMTCPCANAPSGPGRGCDNSASTGGASISAAGAAYLSMDSLVLTAIGEKPTALSVFSQGTALIANGVTFGQGVRCAGGSLTRLYVKMASGGIVSAPQGGDLSVSARSAALGDLIAPGSTRYYYVYYRDSIVLGGCPAVSTFNTTQTGRIDWSL